MVCPSCGVDNKEGAQACFTCGHRLEPEICQGTLIHGRYEIQRPLGKGGMGVVYLAHDRVLDERVAIKLLRSDIARSPEFARRFRSEIKLARKVSHRNVCRIHEYGEERGIRYISMEFIEGIDLRQVIRGKTLSLLEAFDVSIQVAGGLEAIQEVGIIHRDLKTANLMRDGRGLVKLMDFGIAKEQGSSATAATATGTIVGTPEYMSPEQARGEKLDFRSDVYSLGVVVYEIFSGKVPFRAETPLATILKHLHDPPPLEGIGLPEPLVPVLRRALAKEPRERYASAGAMAEALKQARAACAGGAVSPRSPITTALAPDVEPTVAQAPVPTLQAEAPTVADRGTLALTEPMQAAEPIRPPAGDRPRQERRAHVRGAVAARPRWQLPAALAGVALLGAAGGVWIVGRGVAPGPSGPGGNLPAGEDAGDRGAPAPLPRSTPTPLEEVTIVPANPSLSPVSTARAADIPAKDTRPLSRPSMAPRPAALVKATPGAPQRSDPAPASPPIASAPVASPSAAPSPEAAPLAEPKRAEPSAPPAENPAAAAPAPPAAGAPSVKPPDAPPARGDLVQPGPGVIPPQVARLTKPAYPVLARRLKKETTLSVRVLVDENGKVANAQIELGDASGLGFNEAAIEAAYKTTFKPATKNGVPVKMWARLPVFFSLQ
jgi:serine/threonine-protein kinase